MKQADFSLQGLEQQGFSDWCRLLDAGHNSSAPSLGGIYAVIRPNKAVPVFLARSSGGWFKGKNPAKSIDVLLANWVDQAATLYIGKSDDLRRRLREFAAFGSGRPIGHWGGRLIWQLADADELLVGWKTTAGRSPLAVETDLIREFRTAYGKPPFANDPHRLGR